MPTWVGLISWIASLGDINCNEKSKMVSAYFYHLLDMSVINSWLIYKDLKSTEADPSILNLCQYRLELAEALSKVGNASELCNKRGRPSTSNSTEKNLQAKKKRGPCQYIPPKDIRTDNVGYWPDDCVRSRCKIPGCTGYTQKQSVKSVEYLYVCQRLKTASEIFIINICIFYNKCMML
ncbi:hypothetical protein EVAR_55198_1 [Eumeta japonica]|uniref:PiggyBac transposable element-derived protein domain-containing protein n=1 Tax=Eumeta variegata TaxID=151549 RepID=A0A4C1ZFP9_EUMVA|nr:hypothetical protein EVAR_55198_1 [Eumeta japonica]